MLKDVSLWNITTEKKGQEADKKTGQNKPTNLSNTVSSSSGSTALKSPHKEKNPLKQLTKETQEKTPLTMLLFLYM